jgi:hypothetical protein
VVASAGLVSAPANDSGVPAGDLLLIHVERASRDDLSRLLSAGVPVVMEMRDSLFVEGTQDHLRWLDDQGYVSTILDGNPVSSDYLVVGLRPDSSMETVRASGTVLHHEENWVLVRVPRGVAIEELASEKVFVTRMPHETLHPPKQVAKRTGLSRAEDFTEPDPVVQAIVDGVLPSSIDQIWADLTSNPPTGTRYSPHQGCTDAATYCYDLYQGLGLPAEYQTYSGSHAPNVIATQTGVLYPDDVYIIIGHLDDLPVNPPAPGADDNASGSVTVLEAARVMSCYAVESTVKYLNVTGEELGLLGSDAYADDAWARGENILGVINMDMNGWEGDGSPDPENLDINYNSGSEWLGLLFAESAQRYDTGLAVDAFYCPSLSASDHYPFWQKGWSAICGITDNEGYCGHGGNYPYYHTSDDTIANCGDPTFFYGAVRTSVATLAELAKPFKIATDRPAYACGSGIGILVGDRDLDADPGLGETVLVEAWSDTDPTPESIVLDERAASSMLFEGVAPTSVEPPVAGDGLVSVAPGDVVTVRYVDALDCDGATAVAYTATAEIDCTAPVISGVLTTDVTGSSAVIVWETNEPADSALLWDDHTPPGRTATVDAQSTSHSVELTGLEECTVYFYEAQSTDIAGNTTVDDAGGSFHRFETLGDFGNGLQPCHLGRVVVEQAAPSCSQTVTFRVADLDLNEDPLVADTRMVLVSSSTETDPEPVIVTETGPDTSLFTGSIASTPGAPVPDGMIQAADGDIFTVTYPDADDGQGSPAVTFGTAVFDCHGPRITDLRVETITNSRVTVRWTTDEPADSVVWWGDTPALGQMTSSGASVTSHSVTLNQFSTCQEGYLRVGSTDVQGNAAVVDDHGSPFRIRTWEIPGLYWMDDFENGANGWTLNGEWEIGAPLGNGGSSGIADPAAAYNNAGVLGHDLSGLGAYGGDYEPSISETALSPTLNATTWSNTELIIHRKLSTGDGDSAGLSLKVGPLTVPYFSTDGAAAVDSDYVVETYNVGVFADGKPALTVQFSQSSDGAGQYSGWNVDDVIFKDGTLPDYAACGGCATGPGFAGAATAIDNDACGASGVTVSWNRAVSWGTGGDGTYAVYRDTTPGFTPSGANLVASGLTGLSYNDAGAPTDQTLYYIVLAENDETCSGGPANGGVTDGQAVVVEVQETTSVPVPGETPDLTVDLVAGTHVRLEWGAASDATGYRVYRSTSPQPATFSQLAESDGFVFEDLGEGASASSLYYTVIAINACGQEGP